MYLNYSFHPDVVLVDHIYLEILECIKNKKTKHQEKKTIKNGSMGISITFSNDAYK